MVNTDIILVENSIKIEEWNRSFLYIIKLSQHEEPDFKIPMHTGYIRFKSDSFDIHFEEREEFIKLVMYYNHDENVELEYANKNYKAVSFMYNPKTRMINNVLFPQKHFEELKRELGDEVVINRMCEKFHALMNYSVYNERVAEKREYNKIGKTTNYKSKTERVHSLIRTVYSSERVNNNISQDTDRIKRTFNSELEWLVKGHFRKYRNGKTVWINSYKKGNGTHKNKTYKI